MDCSNIYGLIWKDVAECCVFGARDDIKGQVPVAAVVLKNGVTNNNVVKEIANMVRESLGPVYAFKV